MFVRPGSTGCETAGVSGDTRLELHAGPGLLQTQVQLPVLPRLTVNSV